MRRFVLGWKKLGHEKRWKAYIVNYADDLVICCRVGAETSSGCDADDDVEAETDGEKSRPRRGSVICRKRSSTFWDTRSGGATR